MKDKIVWAVVTSDRYSDEPGYRAYVSLFEKREDALRTMKNSAEEDAEIGGYEVEWYEDEDMCIVGDRWVHTIEELTIN